ncbi:MAG: hypothetical protein APR63_05640 [Desulfuromonas sp. SDB]|nr:MAG: hypothetical protein APR63_05640 [Desulfuromonas sp. SDB]
MFLIFLILLCDYSAFSVMPPKPGLCDDQGRIISTGTTYPGHIFNIEQPSYNLLTEGGKAPPTLHTGVILFDYADLVHSWNHTPSDYEQLLFSTSNPGSMYSFYQEISYGQFTVTGTVTNWVQSYYPHTTYALHYYGLEWIFDPYTQDQSIGVYMLVRDAVYLAESWGFDLNLLDQDGDHVAHGLFVVHAGPGAEATGDTTDVWSHKADARELCELIRQEYDPDCPYIVSRGCTLGVYSMEPEMTDEGDLITVGVFCHEFLHVLGAPDLYNTSSGSYVCGRFELMDAGSWNRLSGESPGMRPAHPSLWLKMLMGWVDPDSLERETPGVPDEMIQATIDGAATPVYPKVWRILRNPGGVDWTDQSPGQGEYFLVENRSKTGFFEVALPDDGLAVWHVDESQPDNNDEEHRLVSLVLASGDPSTKTYGESGDLFSDNTMQLGTRELPSPYMWDGTPSGIKVLNISPPGMVMHADLEAGPVFLGRVFSYPNPFKKLSSGDFCRIKYQPIGRKTEGQYPTFRIIIFNIAGEVVRVLDDPSEINPMGREAFWDGRNDSGDEVSSGMYLYIIELTPFTGERNFGRITFIH